MSNGMTVSSAGRTLFSLVKAW